jgi:hypothetical protein
MCYRQRVIANRLARQQALCNRRKKQAGTCMRPTKGVTQVACHSFCSCFVACFIVTNVAVTFDTNHNLSLFPSQKLSFVALF